MIPSRITRLNSNRRWRSAERSRTSRGIPSPAPGTRIRLQHFPAQLINPAQSLNDRDSIEIGVSDPIETDAAGRWRLGMFPADFRASEPLSIEVSHPDYVSDVTQPRPNPPLEDLRNQSAIHVMTKGLPVRGTVLDPAGKPVEGAALILAWSRSNSMSGIPRRRMPPAGSHSGRPGPASRCSVSGPIGSHRLSTRSLSAPTSNR